MKGLAICETTRSESAAGDFKDCTAGGGGGSGGGAMKVWTRGSCVSCCSDNVGSGIIGETDAGTDTDAEIGFVVGDSTSCWRSLKGLVLVRLVLKADLTRVRTVFMVCSN